MMKPTNIPLQPVSTPRAKVQVCVPMNRRLAASFWLAAMVALLAIPQARAVELDCLVKPEMYVELSSSVNSVIEKILVESGDSVKKGQPLVKLESSVERARLKLARLSAKSVSEIKQRKQQLLYAKGYLQRMKDLLKKNSISEYENDKAATEVALAQIELDKANEKWTVDRRILSWPKSNLP